MAPTVRLSGIYVVSFVGAILFSLLTPTASVAQGDYVLPFEGSTNITSGPGDGSFHSFGPSSEAIDFDLDYGTAIYPTKPGIVEETIWSTRGFGIHITIRHDDGTVSLYAHLRAIAVLEGQRVGYGDKIGEVDSTGNSTGDHLHFEVRDPTQTEGISVRHLVNWKPGCPGCNDYIKGTATGENRAKYEWGDVIETIYWQTYRARISGSQRLDSGRRYLITIAGTMSNWDASVWGTWTGNNASRICEGQAEKFPMVPSPGKINGPVNADPEYLLAYPIYSLPGKGNTCRSGLNNIGDRMDIRFSLDSGGSFTDIIPVESTLNPDHSYQYVVIGKDQPLRLFLGDSYYEDNYGIFVVTIAPGK